MVSLQEMESSNRVQILHTNAPRKVINPSLIFFCNEQIVGPARFFSLSKAICVGEGKF